MNSRRDFVKKTALGTTGLAFGTLGISTSGAKNSLSTTPNSFQDTKNGKKLFWGDIHNHNSVGYAKGSLERSYKIAETHLDFFCVTPQTQWPDMPIMPQNAHMKWVNGFKVAKDKWGEVRKAVDERYIPGKFVPFLGYEWHSGYCGDVCIIFPDNHGDLLYFDDIKKLQEYAKETGAVLIPHHPAYKTGWRGQDWDFIDPGVSPVVEIFSEHGNAETDNAPVRYIRHSMGPRSTGNTIQSLWETGIRAGVVASSDDHLGFPGAYGEGLMAVYADDLTRESVMEAIKAKRTYGVSADRIELDFRLNGHYMGESIPLSGRRNIKVMVNGKDTVDSIEILKNNRVIYRDHPVDKDTDIDSWEKPVICRVEYGWGPWGDLSMERICDWQFEIKISGGNLLSVTPCFQAGPFDENRLNAYSCRNNVCEVNSYTSRKQAFAEQATNSIILEIQGSPETLVSLSLNAPAKLSLQKSLGDLQKSNEILFTGPFTTESLKLHRLVFHDNYHAEFSFEDNSAVKPGDWYYLRVKQANGSLAWSSPVWVG